MRYMRNTQTGESIEVPETDEQKFEELKAARRQDNGRPLWEQTGAHDPDVTQIQVAGQDPANGERPLTQPEIAEGALENAPDLPPTVDPPKAVATSAKSEK